MAVVRLDAGHYAATGGGITLSGGEPLAQADFSKELLAQAKAEGFNTCIETSGAGPVDKLIPFTDLWLFDIKGLPADYERLTGGSFDDVERSLRILSEKKSSIVIRCPVVPGIHDNEGYFNYLSRLKDTYPAVLGIEKLPFHRLGMDKYGALGRECPVGSFFG
jgi:pyruvate formate lyase activating enzyme